jgi:hypothetical protein
MSRMNRSAGARVSLQRRLPMSMSDHQNASQWLTAKGHVPMAVFNGKKQSGDRF